MAYFHGKRSYRMTWETMEIVMILLFLKIHAEVWRIDYYIAKRLEEVLCMVIISCVNTCHNQIIIIYNVNHDLLLCKCLVYTYSCIDVLWVIKMAVKTRGKWNVSLVVFNGCHMDVLPIYDEMQQIAVRLRANDHDSC